MRNEEARNINHDCRQSQNAHQSEAAVRHVHPAPLTNCRGHRYAVAEAWWEWYWQLTLVCSRMAFTSIPNSSSSGGSSSGRKPELPGATPPSAPISPEKPVVSGMKPVPMLGSLRWV